MAEDAPPESMQLTLFLQIRQERKGPVELTRRMQVPIAEGTTGLRSAVKERVADLHWFASGMTLDLLDSKYETEYELEDGAVLADGAVGGTDGDPAGEHTALVSTTEFSGEGTIVIAHG